MRTATRSRSNQSSCRTRASSAISRSSRLRNSEPRSSRSVSPARDPFSAGRFRLRALNGSDEFLLDAADPRAPHALLRRLVLEGGDIDALTIAEYDRLLAAVFETLYGDQVEARTQCAACSEPLDISLSLAALAAAPPDVAIELAGPDERGTFLLPDGRRIRAPTVGDVEHAVRSVDIAALRHACVLEGDADADPELLDAALEAAAPALTRDVTATCPHCAAAQPLRHARGPDAAARSARAFGDRRDRSGALRAARRARQPDREMRYEPRRPRVRRFCAVLRGRRRRAQSRHRQRHRIDRDIAAAPRPPPRCRVRAGLARLVPGDHRAPQPPGAPPGWRAGAARARQRYCDAARPRPRCRRGRAGQRLR